MESGKREFKSKDRMSVELNHYLKITRSHVHQIYRELESSDKVITVDLVRKCIMVWTRIAKRYCRYSGNITNKES